MLNHEVTLDRMFHALADPSRRAMVDRLSKGPATVSELAQPFAMTLAAVVQHLKVLEDGGLVHSQKEGRVRTCRLHAGALASAEQWIGKRRALWEKRLDRLAEVLDEEDVKERKPS
jgi:DNA-binding transcriptional ArsR family regulator